MTLQEKKASYWMAFGPHGPRAVRPPGENWKVFWGTVAGIAVSCVLFGFIRWLARPPPKTMNAQYQAMTNEYLKIRKSIANDRYPYKQAQNTEPITGISSAGYKGKGMIQSKPTKGPLPGEDDD
ncbi:MAG: hypothetical protein Q9186_003788 [Xanthomendoza sp. 1 TL-2023]